MPMKKPHPDAAFTAEMVERFGQYAPVSGRAMFGGHGLFVDGAMFGLVDDGQLYLKADDVNRRAFEAADAAAWSFHQRGETIVSTTYFAIPEDDLDDPAALRTWFEGARGAAQRAAARRRPKKR